MILLNLKSAIRNARNNKIVSFAKIFGLSLSFFVVLFAAGYVHFEMSYDDCIPDKDRIYRGIMKGKLNGRDADFAVTSSRMAEAAVKEIPEVVDAVRLISRGGCTFIYNDFIFEGDRHILVDSNFFSFFGFSFIANEQNPFATEEGIAINKSLAIKYFGGVEAALNKPIKFEGTDCYVSAVFDDIPPNFHLQFDVLRSIEVDSRSRNSWGSQELHTYFKTSLADVDVDELSFKLTKMTLPNMLPQLEISEAENLEQLKASPETYMLFIAEPLKDIHFGKHRFDPAVTSNKIYVYGAIILAILVFLISSINYVNLSIAKLSTRFTEIAIRKTTGAFNSQIAAQFVSETFIFWIVSFIIALGLYAIAIQPLADYLDFEIKTNIAQQLKLIVFVLLGLLIFNLVTNIFPIIFISKRKIHSLIKKDQTASGNYSLKNIFVFVQFVLSGLIILGAISVNRQIDFMVNKDMGYEAENVIMLNIWALNESKRKTFIEELQKETVIKNVTSCNFYFGRDPSMGDAYFEVQESQNYFHATHIDVDDQFKETFNLQMKEGRFFKKELQSDYNTCIINEAAIREYMGEGTMVGKYIVSNGRTYEVIGIVEDFNFRSLHHKVAPLIIYKTENLGNLCIKINNNQISEAENILQAIWSEYNFDRPLDHTFHDEVLVENYYSDKQAKKLLLVLSIISVLIAGIGLYAISYFTILKKTKEFAIRKINGASILSISGSLFQKFLLLVVTAFVISIPISIILINKWLQNFAYQVPLDWWLFVFAIAITVLISAVSIGWHVLKAALRNPVEALRYE